MTHVHGPVADWILHQAVSHSKFMKILTETSSNRQMVARKNKADAVRKCEKRKAAVEKLAPNLEKLHAPRSTSRFVGTVFSV